MSSPLVIRLRNWVGDVVLSTVVLRRLQDAGYELHLIGKEWSLDLLEGFGWSQEKLGATTGERVKQLSRWRHAVAQTRWGARGPIQALSLPYSFSSAAEMRLAGLRSLGYDGEGRALFLSRSYPRPRDGAHELSVYWALGQKLLGLNEPVPQQLQWRISPRHKEQARMLMQAHGIEPGFIMICPFAGGTFEGLHKRWPAFAAFAQTQLPHLQRQVVICPGPGEEAEAARDYGQAIVLPDVGLGACAALMRQAGLMISNDTGPGHLAAAVGAPLLSVLGPTEPARWGAWGPTVHTERVWPGWPQPEVVFERARVLLLDRNAATIW